MPILVAQRLQKAFGEHIILNDVSLSIDDGERVGLVGINGSGKSTLARMLASQELPDAGELALRRETSVAYLSQDERFDEHKTIRQVVIEGLAAWSQAKARYDQITRELEHGSGDLHALVEKQTIAAADVERLGGWDVMHKVDAILDHVGLRRPDALVGTLSGGDRRRVALARVLLARPTLAILDEPSNHLDVETIEWLEQHLIEEFKGALLLITHDRYLLDRVVQRTLELHQGSLYSYPGGYEEYVQAKAERLALDARTEANRQRFLRRELEWLSRMPKARTTKQKARIQRAEAALQTAAPTYERTAKLQLDATRSGKTILELRGLGLRIGDQQLVRGLDLIVNPGERVGVIGRNGIGKTTLVRAILGEIEPSEGAIVVGKNTNIAYFDQHRANLDDSQSIFENVSLGRTHVHVGGRDVEMHAYLDRFLFDTRKQRQPVGSLSGGERARVALAKLMCNGANLVLPDEPTNDLDVATLGALEELLTEWEGSSMVVTHDRWFLNRVATSILAFESDGRVVWYAGNYDAYKLQRAHAEQEAQAQISSQPPKTAREKTKAKPRGLTYAERLELDRIFDQIGQAEALVAELEGKLADPSLYAQGGARISELHQQLKAAQADAQRLTDRWEQLESKRLEGEAGQD